jgi:plastocyanin
MRRAAAAALAAALLWAAPAAAHPGHSSPTVSISSFAFTPPTIYVYVNDTVTWFWPASGPTNHSVTADEGSPAQFDSDPGKPPLSVNHPASDLFPYFFSQPGTYTYHCKVHPDLMRGTVVVSPAPAGTPPPDTTPPRLTRLRARMERRCARKTRACATRVLRVRFAVDKASDVTVAIKRRGARSLSRIKFITVPRGQAVVPVETARFRRGRYVATITATDAAGNQSRDVSTGFRL